VDIIRRQIEHCDIAEGEQITVIEAALKRMHDVMSAQKNISNNIRMAVAEMEEALSAMKMVRKTRMTALKEERRVVGKLRTPMKEPLKKRKRTSSPGSDEVIKGVEKATMTSPPPMKGKDKRKDKGAPETLAKVGGSNQVLTQEPGSPAPSSVAEEDFTKVKEEREEEASCSSKGSSHTF
jgi:phage-related tail protein